MKYLVFLIVFAGVFCEYTFAAKKSFLPKVELSKILAVKRGLKKPQQMSIDTLIGEQIKTLDRTDAFSVLSFILSVLVIVSDNSSEEESADDIFGIVANKIRSSKINVNQKFVLGENGYEGTLLHVLFARIILFDYVAKRVNCDRNFYLGSFEIDFNKLRSLSVDNILECCVFIDLLVFAGAKTDILDSKDRSYQDLVNVARDRFPFSSETTE